MRRAAGRRRSASRWRTCSPGMYASVAILAALRHREASGDGQTIDMALLDTQVAMLANLGANYLVTGVAPERAGNAHQNIVPYQVFEVGATGI